MVATAYDAKIDGIYYNFSGNNAMVTHQKYSNGVYTSDYSGTVVIPSTVTYSGKIYSVTSIGNGAFSFCNSMTDVYCYAENIPETDSNAFEYSSIATVTLHVPEGLIEAYRTTAPWSSFKDIVALTSIHGDTNHDGKVDIADAVAILIVMSLGEWDDAADVNGDGMVDIADYIAILNIMAEQ